MPYLTPARLSEAVKHLAQGCPRIVAGCTDYFPSQAQGQIPDTLLDISRVAELQGIMHVGDGWRIGAAVTWTDVIQANLPPAFDALKLAAREVGSVQIQNRATVAGNLCNASPAADGVPPLLALRAQVELSGPDGTRQIALGDFITDGRQIALGADELVSAVIIPEVSPNARSGFLKLGSRTHLVISIAMVAAVLEVDKDTIAQATVAVGSCSPVAQRLTALEQALAGQSVDALEDLSISEKMLSPLSPISDVRGSAGYRLDVVAELIRRTLRQAAGVF